MRGASSAQTLILIDGVRVNDPSGGGFDFADLTTDGVTIGAHSIVGAGAVVTRDVPAYAVSAGVPAKVLRDRREPKSVAVSSS